MNQQTPNHAQTETIPSDRSAKVTLRELTARLFFRFRIFIACTVIVPLLSVFFVSLIPPKYEVTAKLLVGYDESVSPYFREIAIAKRQIISGQSNAEILKSLPVCYRVVKAMDMQSSDIAKPAFKVLLSHFIRPLYRLFENDEDRENAAKTNKKMLLAKQFQESISPKIILKGRQEIEVNNELIEVTVQSFNYDKIADITNHLCNEFIEEYYGLYAEEAKRAQSYLNQQIVQVEHEILNGNFEKFQSYQVAGKTTVPVKHSGGKFSERNIQANPLVESISRQVAGLELKLTRLKATFSSDSPEVIKAQTELNAARNRLKMHKAKESAESVLNILKEKQQQAEMSLQIYKNRLIPISLVEEAVRPNRSSALLILRYVSTGVIGLFAGIAMGIIMVMFFSAIDNRIYTPWDLDKVEGYSVIGSIPEIQRLDQKVNDVGNLPFREAANAVMAALGRLDLIGSGKGIILVVSGASKGEGKTFTVLQIANAIAHDKRVKVLAVDANFENPDLSEILGQWAPIANQQKGMIDFLRGDENINDLIIETNKDNLFLLPAGQNQKRLSLGFFKKSLKAAFKDIRSEYDLIIIDTPGLLVSTDAAMFASESDNVMMVIKSGATRREVIGQSKTILREVGAQFMGVIMNFRKYPIPRFFYRQG